MKKHVSEAVDRLLGEDTFPTDEDLPFVVDENVIRALAWHHLEDAKKAIEMGNMDIYDFSMKDLREIADEPLAEEKPELSEYVSGLIKEGEDLKPEEEEAAPEGGEGYEEEPPMEPEELPAE